MIKKGKRNFYSQFSSKSFCEIMDILNQLNRDEKEFILNAHAGDLSSERLILSSDDTQKYYDLVYKMKREIGHSNNGLIFSDNIVNDFYKKIKYNKLSKKEEFHFIRKAKLSFLADEDEITLERQEKYIEYYMEEFPLFKKQYEESHGAEKEELLLKAIDNSFEWRNKFLENNQLLVWCWAKKYNPDFLTFMELINEGNCALLMALKEFDIERGNKFSTYATESIKREIKRAIFNKDAKVRIPVHVREDIIKLNFVEGELIKELLRNPTYEELAEKTGMEKSRVIELKTEIIDDVDSLDRIISDQDGNNIVLGDFVSDRTVRGIDEFITDKLYYKQFIDSFEKAELGAPDRKMILMRYGLYDGEEHVPGKIAKKMNVSRQTVNNRIKNCFETLAKTDEMVALMDDGMERKLVKTLKN